MLMYRLIFVFFVKVEFIEAHEVSYDLLSLSQLLVVWLLSIVCYISSCIGMHYNATKVMHSYICNLLGSCCGWG